MQKQVISRSGDSLWDFYRSPIRDRKDKAPLQTWACERFLLSNWKHRPADLHATATVTYTSYRLAFSSLIERPLMHSPIVGRIVRVMASQGNRIATTGAGSAPTVGSSDAPLASDDAVLRLARLIGRQIAREQFERHDARERNRHQRKSTKHP